MFRLLNRIDNIYAQSLVFTLAWQLALLPLFLFDLIQYNPLLEWTDILPNFIFIFLISSLTSSPLFSFALIFAVYIAGVVLYYFTKQNLTFAQTTNIPELITAYSSTGYFAIAMALAVLYAAFRISRKLNFVSQDMKPRIFRIGLCVVVMLFAAFGTQLYFPKIYGYNVESFNKFASWKHGGQLYSIIYLHAERQNMLRKLSAVSDEPRPTLAFEDRAPPKLMIMILLESFVPRSEVRPDDFEPFLRDKGFESVVLESPAFGGLSAKSEFEILCGIPEVQPLGDMTLNYLGTRDVGVCLPSILSSQGYRTISIVGTAAHFHNAENAYQAFGFDRIISKHDLSLDDMDGVHPSDETLFNRALEEILNEKDENLFIYMFTAAGHSPFDLNPEKRPRLSDDLYFDRVTYTERELEGFIDRLDEMRSDVSILVAGDHAARNSILTGELSTRDPHLLRVWYRSPNSKAGMSNCSQYFEMPKFFTGQNCEGTNKSDDGIFGRGGNFPLHDMAEILTLQLIKGSQQ